MRCREFEDRMNDVLDQRLAPERDELLLLHAGECSPCRRLLDGQAVLMAGVEVLETPPLSPRFTAAVLVRSGVVPVASVQAQPRFGRKWIVDLGGLLTLASVALIAVAIGFGGRGGPPRIVRQKPPPTKAVEDRSLAVQSPQRVPPALPSGKSLATANERAPVAPAPVAGEDYQQYRQAINSFAAQLPEAVEKIDEVQQSTPGIRPIRASFSMAIGTLQRTIPNRKREQPPMAKPDNGFSPFLRNVVV